MPIPQEYGTPLNHRKFLIHTAIDLFQDTITLEIQVDGLVYERFVPAFVIEDIRSHLPRGFWGLRMEMFTSRKTSHGLWSTLPEGSQPKMVKG